MVSSEKFSLRWNDFEQNIGHSFREFREERELFDCTIACDDDQVKAHKVILSACSGFFREIFRRNPHQHPLLYMKGVRMRELNHLVNFMYLGEVNVAQDELNQFLAVAEDLKVKGLTQSATGGQDQLESERSPARTGEMSGQQPPAKKQRTAHRTSSGRDSSFKMSSAVSSENQQQIQYNNKHALVVKNESVGRDGHNITDGGGRGSEMAVVGLGEEGGQAYQSQHGGYHQDYSAFYNTGDDNDYTGSVMMEAHTNISMENSNYTASEITKLIEQYLVRLEDDPEGSVWACTACDKRSRVKHHMREHIEVNHIDCLTFTCPYCKSEQKNRVSFRSHISKRHREEHKMNSVGSKQQLAIQY